MMNWVKNLKVQHFTSHEALGKLVAVESQKDIPIPIRRVFYVFGTDQNVVRGKHAHRECTQVLICVNGSCEVICDDGSDTARFVLKSPEEFLVIPPGIWASERYCNRDTVLLVMTDTPYNPKEYIRNYDDFIDWRKSEKIAA